MASSQFLIFEAPTPLSQKAAANGVATLDGTSKIPIAQIPSGIAGGLNFLGTWDAATNTPTLSNGSGTVGDYYIVSIAGSTSLDGITDWAAGDWVISNNTPTWDKIDQSNAVLSVAGKTGVVTLDTGDITDLPVTSGTVANVLGAASVTAAELAPDSVAESELAARDSVKTFNAAFEGAVTLIASGSNGTLTLVHETTPPSSNYYNWVGQTGALAEAQIAFLVTIPSGFVDWANGTTAAELTLMMQNASASAAVNKVTVAMEDTAGTAVTLTGGTDLVTAAATWESKAITFVEGSWVFTVGSTIVFRIRMFSTSSGETRIEQLKLNWRTK